MNRKRGDFEFLKHYCKCCGQEIPLKKERLKKYERLGYPEYIHDHARKINAKKGGRRKLTEFSFLPHYCKCCNGEIHLDRKAIRRYENYGYPIYISGHQMKGRKRPDSSKRMKEDNPMHNPEIAKKLSVKNTGIPHPKMRGIKRPDTAILMRTKNPMWNPEYVQKCLFSRYGEKFTKKEIIDNPKITTILKNEYLQKSRLDILLEKQQQNKNIPEKVVEIPVIKPLPSMIPIHPEVIKPKIPEPIPIIKPSEIEIKPVLSYEEQLKIALERVKINRENNLKENKLKPIIPEAEEDNAYADRIKDLVGKFGDTEKKEKHYIKPLWKVKPKT